MKYMLQIFHEERAGERTPEALAPWQRFSEEAQKLGAEIAAGPLESATTASTVSVRDGKVLITDGPFIETKEQLCGFYVFECESLATAQTLASMIPLASSGHIEVRQVSDFGA
ncbi:MAG TPA: YciI family protein [Dehalococcoidia bacterium]|jgi:hypothetical protein|nr:YciI family protein [Dehalococcoidia bacterium]